ncbi:MAG: TonB-dependent receptor plug domain-containing protein [Ferruginibacter sp.]
MKLYCTLALASLLPALAFSQQKTFNDTAFLKPVEISSVRSNKLMPVASTLLGKKDIQDKNIGQDLPFILDETPNVVVNSDAGNGIGYTGIRLRGSDASRINVTINGIPFNDPESQGSFFVDIPDIAASAESIEIQRGVGTSSSGSGSFGGSININTNENSLDKKIILSNTAGSYHSLRNAFSLSTGLIGKHFTIDGRLSNIRSDGYIRRAASRLQSYYASVAWIDSSNSLRLNIFNGQEKTYQAWYGIDEITLKRDRRYNAAGTEAPGEPYSDETDNYTQHHYQLFYNHAFSNQWKAVIAPFYIRGKGYYEQYKANQKLSKYGLPDYTSGGTTISRTDLIRRLWLDNDFYGAIASLQLNQPQRQVIAGGSYNDYKGGHYGEIYKAQQQVAVPENYRYYEVPAIKQEVTGYVKWTEKLTGRLNSFADLQVRNVDYKLHGFRDNPALDISNNYTFFNPKLGLVYNTDASKIFLSWGKSQKEPNRDDFEAGVNQQPAAEKLQDWELGIQTNKYKASWGVNFYFMNYTDQLVLTGQVNDVGAYSRTNVPSSYRAGIELSGKVILSPVFSIMGNASFSRNKVKDFTEYLDDYDNGGQVNKSYHNTNLAFSPEVVSAATLQILPFRNAKILFTGKYVGRQYLDNTSQASRSLHAYYTQDLRLNYNISQLTAKRIEIFAQAINIFNRKYEPNGYSFSYIYQNATTTENYYFPMAPLHFMMGITIEL